MTRGRIIAAVVALLVVGAVIAGVVVSAQNAVPQVSVATAQAETLGVIVTASGKVEAGSSADVFPPAPGTLASVSVKDGDSVKAGQVLAQMETGQFEIAIDQARAALRAADAQLAAVKSGGPSAADRTAAAAGVTAAQSAYDLAKGGYDLIKASYDATTPMGKASMEASLAVAASQRDSAYAGLAQARSAYDKVVNSSTSAARNAAAAARTQAATALRLAEDNLDKATMVAPMDGVVISNSLGMPGPDGTTPKAAPGEPVSPASAPFTVVRLGGLTFDAQVDEADIDRVKSGLKAKVSLDAFPSDTFDGTVATVRTYAIQTTTGGIAFPVLIDLDAKDKNVLLGMSGSTDIEVSAVSGALTVPIEAIFDESGSKYVFVVKDGKVKKTLVTTGALTDTRAQILSGISDGDQVALGGLSALKDGSAVRVKP